MVPTEFENLVRTAVDTDLALARSGTKDEKLEERKFEGLYPLLIAKRKDPTLGVLVSLNIGTTSSGVVERMHAFSLTTGDVCVDDPYQTGQPYYIPLSLDSLRTERAYGDLPELANSTDVITELIGDYSPRKANLKAYYRRSTIELMEVNQARREAIAEGDHKYSDWTLAFSNLLIERFLTLRAEPELRPLILVTTNLDRGVVGLRLLNGGIFKASIPLGASHPNTIKYQRLISISGGPDPERVFKTKG